MKIRIFALAIALGSATLSACVGGGNASKPSRAAQVDTYANCLQGGASKKACVVIAKAFGQSPPPQDRNMTPAPTSTPAPTPAPTATPSPEDPKRAFIRSVDESLSAARILAAPYKYVGRNVDLHCTVANIPADDFFNATCGANADGFPAIIAIIADSRQLSQGQAVRVLGTVIEPIEGKNGFGGTTHFAAVEAHYME